METENFQYAGSECGAASAVTCSSHRVQTVSYDDAGGGASSESNSIHPFNIIDFHSGDNTSNEIDMMPVPETLSNISSIPNETNTHTGEQNEPNANSNPPIVEPETSNPSSSNFVLPAPISDQNGTIVVAKDKEKCRITKLKTMLPSDVMKQQHNPLPYKEPPSGGLSTKTNYSLEILKNGIIVDSINLNSKSFYVFGRLPACDIFMEHPSLSRYHAVIQCFPSPEGTCDWHLYDLNSTHGTMLNNKKIKPNEYHPLMVGHMMKLAGSTRIIILQGPSDEEEKESDMSVTELKQEYEAKKQAILDKIKQQKQEADLKVEDEKIEEDEKTENEGCSWGMGEDAVNDESEPLFNMTETPEHEHLYIDDPKKALKSYFEREGWDIPEYKFGDDKLGTHNCYVELPVDTPSGEPLIAEVAISGKKKEAVIACALEACRLLDRMGELHKAHQESRKRKAKNWEENDFYESDEDTFLDRTGVVEKKRLLRMKKAGKVDEKPENFESLSSQLNSVQKEIADIENSLEKAKKDAPKIDYDGVDALDAYMNAIKSGSLDAKSRIKMKRQLMDLKREEIRLQRLASFAKPALPTLSESLVTRSPIKCSLMKTNSNGPTISSVKTCDNSRLTPSPNKLSKTENDMASDHIADDHCLKNKENLEITARDTDRVCTESNSNFDSQNDITSSKCSLTESKEKKCLPDAKAIEMEDHIESISSEINIASEKSQTVTKLKENDDTKSCMDFVKQVKKANQSKKSDSKCHKGIGFLANKIINIKNTACVKDKKSTNDSDYCSNDPDYAVWLPPQDQSGDGKTHLNDKFGY